MAVRGEVHLCNAWLPPPVAELTSREADAFAAVVRSVKEAWRPEDPDSVYSTLKWISLIESFLKARSEVSLVDIETLVLIGLELFPLSQNKLYAQVRWGNILRMLLKKFGKKLSVKVLWRSLYDSLIQTHFKRNTGPEGLRLRQRHFEAVTSLVKCCRKFFPSGSAFEIWTEFRILLENPWHNSSFEGAGFIQLFLPTNPDNEDFFTNEWIQKCIDIWESVPNCQFWDLQWSSVVARCIKSYKALDWEHFLPSLFTKYVNVFEVPVANRNASYPFNLEVPRNIRFLFSSKNGLPAQAISTSIVHLLKPGSSAQNHFAKLADLLEQFFHPSNGGRWTYSLERFLRYLIIAFQKRLQHENFNSSDDKQHQFYLGKSERAAFVEVILRLIDRGQYSKNEALAETVAVAMSILSYVEPSLILPFIASRFHLALQTDTATHQLKASIISVAFASRAMCFASVSSLTENLSGADALIDLLSLSLSNSLLGMDANDPPKTMATLQLIGSILSNIPMLSDEGHPVVFRAFNFSEWLDEFFSRLFSLLRHLEPRSVLSEGGHVSSASGTFLVEDTPYYYCLLEILLGKLSEPLYMQALKKISKFVNGNVLPGAIAEVGFLCCACVHANPKEAARFLIEPILMTTIASLEESPVSGYGGKGISDASFLPKATLSPALETALGYHLRILAISISYAGPVLLGYREELKGVISSAFEAPSWKVNVAGEHVLRSLLGSLVLYYPIDQYKCFSRHHIASSLEEWLRSKFDEDECVPFPKWHIPCEDEIDFANELMDLHLRSPLDDLLTICKTRIHSEAGNEKDHLKVTLLRIFSSLQGVLSCLPDLSPSFKAVKNKHKDLDFLSIVGSSGASVGSSELRERAAQDIHAACKYILEQRSDDSILLLLMIRIMDALANVGSLENEEWSHHMQCWKTDSAAIIEPSCNFIVSTHSKGKKRPRWAVIVKAYMHNTWRSSQSSYHKFRTDSNVFPSELLILLLDDLLNLALHSYETVRSLATGSVLKILKRWPSLISRCIVSVSCKLSDPSSPENVVLGSCSILNSQTVLRHLIMDAKAFSSFILGLLASSHHESLKAQKAVSELFIKYNIHFSGLPKSFFQTTTDHSDNPEFADVVSKISEMSFDSNGLHWRYNLMANRVLLLLTLASRNDSNQSSNIVGETTGHFLKNLKSQLPQSRILAISALNTLLIGSHHKITSQEQNQCSGLSADRIDIANDRTLNEIIQEEGFFSQTFNSLSHVHITSDTESTSAKGNHGTSIQNMADKAITIFYFDFSASWPRTPNWVSLLRGDTFYSNFARIFKRLAQECGPPLIQAMRSNLEEFLSSKERSKQCVAAEALAGLLHSDIVGLLEAWESWIVFQLNKMIAAPSVESMPDWAACIRYAVTGKGKNGARIPLLRNKIFDCLLSPLGKNVATNIVAKRYIFLLAAFMEISPIRMSIEEVHYHNKFMEELLQNMSHSSAQVREAVGVSLSILCSNIRLFRSLSDEESCRHADMLIDPGGKDWVLHLSDQASKLAFKIQNSNYFESLQISAELAHENGISHSEMLEDVKKTETMLHFIISTLKSGRSSYLLDTIVGLLYPVISLQETSHKELSILAKATFELMKWRILPRPHLENAISILSSLIDDKNWRTRFASLTFLQSFMYRHIFILSSTEKLLIWKCIEKLLVDNQIEVREHAAGALASLLKSEDEQMAYSFRDRAYTEALLIYKKRNLRVRNSSRSTASIHGAVLALAASVLSTPYDMPSWLPDHVTLLARFISEPSPVKSTARKAVAEFRRTHADTWIIQKDSFTEEQLEALADTSSSSTYFA